MYCICPEKRYCLSFCYCYLRRRCCCRLLPAANDLYRRARSHRTGSLKYILLLSVHLYIYINCSMPVLYIYMRTWMKPTVDARRLSYWADDVSCGDRPRRYYHQTYYYKRVRETEVCVDVRWSRVLSYWDLRCINCYTFIFLFIYINKNDMFLMFEMRGPRSQIFIFVYKYINSDTYVNISCSNNRISIFQIS